MKNYTTLYLKSRPQLFSELDSSEARDSLTRIFSSGKVPHAFLLAGPKGIGKTSAARIIAKVINCEHLKGTDPCNKCEQCVSITKGNNLDVIEMDAASHRGIDDIRILRDAVKLAPTKAKKKIYIIDEAHMLTTEASNALLKTLEEPPEHVIFILATTNPEKLIDTIRSRTTYIPFRKANIDEIVRSLGRVIAGEKIKIDKGALEVIAKVSGGSFRDAIKILEQLVSEDKDLKKESLEESLFRQKDFDLDKFTDLLAQRKVKELLEEVEKFEVKGVSVEIFLESFLRKLQEALLAKSGMDKEDIKTFDKAGLIELIDLFLEAFRNIPESPIEELPLEIAIIKWCGEENESSGHSRSVRLEIDSPSAEGGNDSVNSGSNTSGPTEISDFNSVPEGLVQIGVSGTSEPASVSTEDLADRLTSINDDIWKKILSLVKPINASVEALLRSAKPMTYDGKTLTLGVFYKFHKERLEDNRHRRILEDVIAGVFQSPTKVICTLMEPPPKKIVEEAKTANVLTEGEDKDIIKAAEEIFSS